MSWTNFVSNPDTPENISSQTIWFNENIKIKGSVVHYKDWSSKGVNYIGNLFNDQRQLLTIEDFKAKFKIKCNFLQYSGIIYSIPSKWKNIIKNSSIDINSRENCDIFFLESKVKK